MHLVMIKTNTAYHLVAEALRNKILKGELKAGARVPTEDELCRQYATSRITVRRALQILEEELLVQRRQGSGTYVAPSPSKKIPILNIGFFNSVSRHAPGMRRKLLSWSRVPADANLAAMLETVFGDELLHARRVDVLKGKPVAMDDLYLLGRVADKLSEDELADLNFVYRWQMTQNLTLSYCRQTVEAAAASDEIGKILGVREGTPVLKECDVMFLQTGSPAGVFISHYRSDRFQFSSIVRISESGSADTGT